jgi:pimeloyl-ACP methyl ester carboxylesterase
VSAAYRRPAIPRLLRRDPTQFWIEASRGSCSLLSRISPALSARWAEWLFRTPPPCPPRPREQAVLARGKRRNLEGPRGRIATWSWGEGRTILLAHGWGGHAGRLTRYVDPLTRAGFRVVAFDAPGHGESSGGRVSLPDFTLAVVRIAERVGPLYGVVAHCLGATATAIALREGLPLNRAVFLSPAADPERLSTRFARMLRLSEAECELMKGRYLQRYNLRWSELKIVDWVRSLSTSLLVFHDRGDFKVPLAEGQAIVSAWPRGELVMTRGLGHHKILRDAAVIARAVEFLARTNKETLQQPRTLEPSSAIALATH